MKKANVCYFSASPETGSEKVLKLMNKPFNYEHFNNLVRKANNLGIKIQACFILGFPGEKEEDRKLTEKYIIKLAKLGVDEIAVYILTPLPGAKIYEEKLFEFQDYEELSFSPRWRTDYKLLNKWRKKCFLKFLLYKSRYHPVKAAKNVLNLITGNFETKMEMSAYRLIKTKIFKR